MTNRNTNKVAAASGWLFTVLHNRPWNSPILFQGYALFNLDLPLTFDWTALTFSIQGQWLLVIWWNLLPQETMLEWISRKLISKLIHSFISNKLRNQLFAQTVQLNIVCLPHYILYYWFKHFKCNCFFPCYRNSPLKVRYPKRAASRYMRNMARKDTLATPCIFLRERLFRREKRGCLVWTPEYRFCVNVR